MGRPIVFEKALTAGSANGIALSQALAAAGYLTLNGASVTGGVAVLGSQRRVIITSAGDDSGLTWTVIGATDGGQVIKDQFAGALGAAQSNLNFATVTSIYGNGAAAGNVTAGTNSVGSTPWAIWDPHMTPPMMSIDVDLLSGSGTCQVEYTYDNFLPAVQGNAAIAYASASPNPTPILHPQLQGLSGDQEGAINWNVRAWRFTILTGTASWRCTGIPAGISGP